MSDERSSFKRPGERAAADRGRSRLGDTTRPISVDRRLTTQRSYSLLLWVAAVGVAGALAASLFVLPIRTYFDQNTELEQRADQLRQLEEVNADLRAEVERLQSDAGVREAAREQLGYQQEDEVRETIIDRNVVPLNLPAGWPYDLVTGIATTRRNGG